MGDGVGAVGELGVRHTEVIVNGSVVRGSLDGFLQQVAGGGVIAFLVVDPGERVGAAGRVGHSTAGDLGQGKGNVKVLPGLDHQEGKIVGSDWLFRLDSESFL